MAPATQCFIDPMDCIYEVHYNHRLVKRMPAPPTTPEVPPPPPPTAAAPEEPPAVTKETWIILGAALGSLFMVLLLGLFACYLKKRRASRRIGQLQRFLPTFMDEKNTAKYFKNQSQTTLVDTSASRVSLSKNGAPSTATTAAASTTAYAQGVKDPRYSLDRKESLGVFQKISLSQEREATEEQSTSSPSKIRTLFGANSNSGRSRAPSSPTSRPPLVGVETFQDQYSAPSMPPAVVVSNLAQFPEGLELRQQGGEGHLNQPSQSTNNSRYSAGLLDLDGYDIQSDPLRFSTASLLFDAQRLSTQSNQSSASGVTSGSSEDDLASHLPAHQQHHSFHSNPTTPGWNHGRDMSMGSQVDGPIMMLDDGSLPSEANASGLTVNTASPGMASVKRSASLIGRSSPERNTHDGEGRSAYGTMPSRPTSMLPRPHAEGQVPNLYFGDKEELEETL